MTNKIGIVIPYGKNTPSFDRLESSIALQNYPVEIFKIYNLCRSAGRNIGYKHFKDKADYLLFLDADMVLCKDYIQKFFEQIEKYPGSIAVGLRYGYSNIAESKVDDTHFLLKNLPASYQFKRVSWKQCESNNFMISVKTFEKLGGFWEGYKGWGMEDTDFFYRASRLGIKIYKTADPVCIHQSHSTGRFALPYYNNICKFFRRFPELKRNRDVNIAVNHTLSALIRSTQ
jgi:GT2 family glycosyltransferase